MLVAREDLGRPDWTLLVEECLGAERSVPARSGWLADCCTETEESLPVRLDEGDLGWCRSGLSWLADWWLAEESMPVRLVEEEDLTVCRSDTSWLDDRCWEAEMSFPVHWEDGETSDPGWLADWCTSTEESVPVRPVEKGWKNSSESLKIAVGGEWDGGTLIEAQKVGWSDGWRVLAIRSASSLLKRSVHFLSSSSYLDCLTDFSAGFLDFEEDGLSFLTFFSGTTGGGDEVVAEAETGPMTATEEGSTSVLSLVGVASNFLASLFSF